MVGGMARKKGGSPAGFGIGENIYPQVLTRVNFRNIVCPCLTAEAQGRDEMSIEEVKPWHRVEPPIVTKEEGPAGDTRHDHPAFATISASRISGSANLFGSNVGHQGFVKIDVHAARMYRDGYSERIHGSGKSYVEVWLSEAQWVSFVSRMNVGSGTPCTLRHYGTGEGMVFCPHIADPEKAAERMGGRISELHAKKLQDIAEQSTVIRELCEGLPARKRDAILRALGSMTQHLEANHKFAAETLREYKEQLVTESRVEFDAMLTDVVGRLGLQSVQQLGAVLAADPSKAMQLLSHDEVTEG